MKARPSRVSTTWRCVWRARKSLLRPSSSSMLSKNAFRKATPWRMQRCCGLRFIVAVTNWTRRRRCCESTWINIPPRVISRKSKTSSPRWKRSPNASKRRLKPAQKDRMQVAGESSALSDDDLPTHSRLTDAQDDAEQHGCSCVTYHAHNSQLSE